MRKNLLYLAKASQYLMIKGAERVRTFDMGRAPEKVKAGRPRDDVDGNQDVALQRAADAPDDIPWEYAV